MTALQATSPVDVQSTLQAKWYNALTAGLGLDPDRFQILQPSPPLGFTSDKLWAYYNTIPPQSLTAAFSAGGGNSFYSDYKGVLAQIQSQAGSTFVRDTGDYYAAWQEYLGSLSPMPSMSTLPEVFREWAMVHATPQIAQKGASDLAALNDDPILAAQVAVLDMSGFMAGVPNFSQAIADLTQAIPSAAQYTVSFNSSQESSDVSQTWAKGEMGGLFDFFEGGGSVDYSSLSAQAASANVTVDATFQHALTFAATPGSWYSSAALSAAYNTQDNTLWTPGTPNWQSTFGPTGNMQRFVTSIVVVDGISATITSDATFDTDDQKSLQADAELAVWPFFEAKASGGFSSNATFDAEGRMTVTVTSPAGNPVVLGANVIPAEQFVGGS